MRAVLLACGDIPQALGMELMPIEITSSSDDVAWFLLGIRCRYHQVGVVFGEPCWQCVKGVIV